MPVFFCSCVCGWCSQRLRRRLPVWFNTKNASCRACEASGDCRMCPILSPPWVPFKRDTFQRMARPLALKGRQNIGGGKQCVAPDSSFIIHHSQLDMRSRFNHILTRSKKKLNCWRLSMTFRKMVISQSKCSLVHKNRSI